MLFAGLVDYVTEGCLVVFEEAHLVALLFHSPPSFKRQSEDLLKLVPRYLGVRVENLYHGTFGAMVLRGVVWLAIAAAAFRLLRAGQLDSYKVENYFRVY